MSSHSTKPSIGSSLRKIASKSSKTAKLKVQIEKLKHHDLPASYRALGKSAFEHRIKPDTYGDDYQELQQLETRLEEKQAGVQQQEDCTISDKAKRAAINIKMKSEAEALKHKKRGQLAQLGEKIYTSESPEEQFFEKLAPVAEIMKKLDELLILLSDVKGDMSGRDEFAQASNERWKHAEFSAQKFTQKVKEKKPPLKSSLILLGLILIISTILILASAKKGRDRVNDIDANLAVNTNHAAQETDSYIRDVKPRGINLLNGKELDSQSPSKQPEPLELQPSQEAAPNTFRHNSRPETVRSDGEKSNGYSEPSNAPSQEPSSTPRRYYRPQGFKPDWAKTMYPAKASSSEQEIPSKNGTFTQPQSVVPDWGKYQYNIQGKYSPEKQEPLNSEGAPEIFISILKNLSSNIERGNQKRINSNTFTRDVKLQKAHYKVLKIVTQQENANINTFFDIGFMEKMSLFDEYSKNWQIRSLLKQVENIAVNITPLSNSFENYNQLKGYKFTLVASLNKKISANDFEKLYLQSLQPNMQQLYHADSKKYLIEYGIISLHDQNASIFLTISDCGMYIIISTNHELVKNFKAKVYSAKKLEEQTDKETELFTINIVELTFNITPQLKEKIRDILYQYIENITVSGSIESIPSHLEIELISSLISYTDSVKFSVKNGGPAKFSIELNCRTSEQASKLTALFKERIELYRELQKPDQHEEVCEFQNNRDKVLIYFNFDK